jgi:ATP-binding cassette, subfamily B (MDR/TAP), member 1
MTSKQESSTVITPSTQDPTSDKSAAEAQKRAPVSNYWRVLSFGTRREHAYLLLGLCCAAASGVALPLMNIVLGNLVGNFNSYFIPGTTTTKSQFLSSVSQNARYIVYLFIAKFFLTYIGTVWLFPPTRRWTDAP